MAWSVFKTQIIKNNLYLLQRCGHAVPVWVHGLIDLIPLSLSHCMCCNAGMGHFILMLHCIFMQRSLLISCKIIDHGALVDMGILSASEKKVFDDDLSPQFVVWVPQSCQELPWIFPGAPLIFNGAPGSIQGNLDRYGSLISMGWWDHCRYSRLVDTFGM